MKTISLLATAALALTAGRASCQYTNFIRQIQFPSKVEYDVTVPNTGEQLSQLPIDPGGARFELWTVNSGDLSSILLDTSYVGTYIPVATVVIRSEDASAALPRTRADRPFYVDVTVSGLLNGADDPVPSKSVKFLRHVQSYGEKGTGIDIDPTQATLLTQASIETNGEQNLTFTLSSVPGADRSKLRGEERFSIFSLEDYQAPESQIASQTIQIWPVADGNISGITHNQLIRYSLPQLTINLNDLYPSSTTYAQVYEGDARLNVSGKVVPGSALVVSESTPVDRVLTIKKYDSVFTSDGRWTMELLTVTPFGIDRLHYVTFDLDRTIDVNASFTTIE